MADEFTKRQMQWIRRVTTDKRLGHVAVHVGTLLATQFLNRRKGYAWPSLATMAEAVGCDEKTIRIAIGKLKSNGYLKSTRSGKGRTNRYALEWAPVPDQEASRVGMGAQSTLPLTGHFADHDRASVPGMSGHQCPIHSNHLIEPSEKMHTPRTSPDDLEQAVRLWNEVAARCPLPECQVLSAKRRKKLGARLAGDLGGLDGWRDMLAKIEASPFLLGAGKGGWRVTLDWVLEPGNLTKLMEGNYADRSGRPKTGIAAAMHDLGERIRAGSDDLGQSGQGDFPNKPPSRRDL